MTSGYVQIKQAVFAKHPKENDLRTNATKGEARAMNGRDDSYSARTGKAAFIVNRKKPSETVFQERCRHKMSGDFQRINR